MLIFTPKPKLGNLWNQILNYAIINLIYRNLWRRYIMIRHVCMFTLKDDNKEKNIADFFEKIEKLRDLDTIKNLT